LQDEIFKEIVNVGSTELLRNAWEKVVGSEVIDTKWVGKILNFNQFSIDNKKKLGEDAYGVVYEGEINGIAVAVKRLKVLTKVDSFVKECALLSKICGPFVARYMGACVYDNNDKKERECYILTELGMIGSLNTLLYGDTKKSIGYMMDIRIKCRILCDIARGMRFLHDDVNLVHGDLKPTNILIDSNFRPRICDFHLSTLLKNYNSELPIDVGTLRLY